MPPNSKTQLEENQSFLPESNYREIIFLFFHFNIIDNPVFYRYL